MSAIMDAESMRKVRFNSFFNEFKGSGAEAIKNQAV